jgi:hypothetical protein
MSSLSSVIRALNLAFRDRAVQRIAADLEHTVPTCAEVLLRGVGGEFDQLLLFKVPAQLGVQILADIRRGVGERRA